MSEEKKEIVEKVNALLAEGKIAELRTFVNKTKAETTKESSSAA